MDMRVEMATSSEDSISLPLYFVAKRPREVAVGRAWMRVQTAMTSSGKCISFRAKKVMTGARMSWRRQVTRRRHFLMIFLKSARESMKPTQMMERGVVALPTKATASVAKAGRVRPVR